MAATAASPPPSRGILDRTEQRAIEIDQASGREDDTKNSAIAPVREVRRTSIIRLVPAISGSSEAIVSER